MANKFIGLDDAATQLGISKDKLNEIRESGAVRAYRDGVSWKFRTEEIDSLGEDIKSGNLPSGIDLGESISLESDESTGLSSLSLAPASDLDVEVTEEPAKKEEPSAGASDLDLEMLDEPTVAAEADDDNESILLSEDELGDSPDRPPSTIIGRSQLRDEPSDDDLLLASPDNAAGMSDVRLADDEDVDDLLGAAKSAAASKFEDLEELEFDLEAESSRILEAQDVAAAQAAASKAKQEKEAAADPSGLGSSLELASDDAGSKAGDTGVHEAKSGQSSAFSLASDEDDELELDLAASDAGLQPDGSDDLVLDSSDDDISLSGGDSGINLKPSDSGLALDDESFALGGSAIGSSLDLGDSLASSGDSLAIGSSASEVSLEGSTAFASSPDFNLQPSDDGDDEDEDDSSQIIALDAVEEPGDEDDEVALTDASAVVVGVPGAQASPVIAQEAVFPMWIVAFLGLSAMLMAVSAIMAADLLRSMWAAEESLTLQSPLIQGFLGLIGLNN
ncbi:hypothetical protein KOR34_06850 [Posidoniimonas corsicana]|uniref:Helix-turn-helix domain protein n=1 Tax=Posidoniimonas corsicana TaxID=1938618 RepID=A0A5C5VC07_9BACT|nr:helix-turn-helix domain-containing protein [Posidoniimonas corsicana]TWT35791.1 hypothetical protein KOR34_06850 [Posidoniimonas corsicana]